MLKKLGFLTKIISASLSFFFIVCFSPLAFGVTVPTPITAAGIDPPAAALPGSVEPGVISKVITQRSPYAGGKERAAGITPPKEEAPKQLGPEAAKIKFKLTKIILEGNHVYSGKELLPLYQDQLNKTISVADLENIVQSITNYYRNNGYILSRAILPPQHVANGVVRVQVIEGYIGEVRVQGNPKRAKWLIQGYGENIKKSNPLQLSVMQYYLRLANEIPGVTVKAVLEPSKTQTGAADLDLVSDITTGSMYLSYDNYETRFIGPDEVSLGITGNSVFQSGDTSHLTVVRTSRPQELKYIDINHDIPLGYTGFRFNIGGNNSHTRPGLNLRPLDIEGDSTDFYLNFQYPIIRDLDQDLTIIGAFNYIDSDVTTIDSAILYYDHIRSIKFGANYDFVDQHRGTNTMSGTIEQGLLILGASDDPTSPTISRFGAEGRFTKFTASVGRLQQLFWRFSLFLFGTGQFSFNPLLATEQFAYGGSQLGRGYDPAEIIGDRGVGGTVELRMDNTPNWVWLNSIQPYAFYDEGVIWNVKNVPGTLKKSSAASAGFGIRMTFIKNLYGNLMWAQPITKEVFAETFVNQGRSPRGFFSITATV